MTRALPVSIPFLLLASACSGGGGGGGTSPGGFVRVEHRLTSGGAEATFARAELTDVRESLPSRGRCKVPEAASGDGICGSSCGRQSLPSAMAHEKSSSA